ncbi:hypothetical protein IJF81_06470, partial [bacterium]|nr:hypothetical protein [bacterium]
MRIMNISPINQNQTITTYKKKNKTVTNNVNFTSSIGYLDNDIKSADIAERNNYENFVNGTLSKLSTESDEHSNRQLMDEYLRNFLFNKNVDINAPEY